VNELCFRRSRAAAKLGCSAAAYLPEEIRLKFSSLLNAEVPVAQGWGMSECVRRPSLSYVSRLTGCQTLTGLTTVPDGIIPGTKTHPNSIGILWPSTEAKIMREDGTHAEVGEPGELFVRGRYIALGYWRNEKATRETFLPDGWLRTGDLVKADEWGNFL
jgi:long-subunit acyl-CoA synthetase (AMP-forming)